MHGLWSSDRGVILIQAFYLSSEYKTARESPAFPQKIVFLSNNTDTQVEPLNNYYLKHLPETGVVPLPLQVIVDLVESIVHLLRHSVVHLSQFVVVFVQAIRFDLHLHVQRKHLFDVGRGMVPVYAMAVANGEEVEAQLVEHVRHQDVSVLVLLVRVARLMADRGCEGKLSDAVESFVRFLHSYLFCFFWLWLTLLFRFFHLLNRLFFFYQLIIHEVIRCCCLRVTTCMSGLLPLSL